MEIVEVKPKYDPAVTARKAGVSAGWTAAIAVVVGYVTRWQMNQEAPSLSEEELAILGTAVLAGIAAAFRAFQNWRKNRMNTGTVPLGTVVVTEAEAEAATPIIVASPDAPTKPDAT